MQYTYVTAALDNFGPGSAKSGSHRAIIDEYAAKGFRYVGFIPCKFGPSGKMVEMDLVFEQTEQSR